jgi:hypothetical protein
VVVVVRPGVVAEVEDDEAEVAEDGKAGTGGRVDKFSFGAGGGFQGWWVCAACEGKG